MTVGGPPGSRASQRRVYAQAAAALVAALFLRWLLDPWLGDQLAVVTLYAAVAFAVWAGGYRPALLVAAVGYLVVNWLFIPPRGQVALDTTSLLGLVAYVVSCAAVIGFGEAMGRARRRAQASLEQAQGEMALRRLAEAELARRNAELREADRHKDEFLATLAHELRNPLAPLRNAVAVLQLSAGADPATARLHAMVQRQVDHLVRLVDDLMEVSRISRGRIDLRKVPTALRDVLDDALETSRPLVEAGGHQVTVSLPPDLPPLDADPVRLAQVFANLLNNAAKYMEPGGRVTIEAQRRDDEAVVAVRDTGVGIPAEMLPRVFDLFTQVDRHLGRAQGGLGIGLALVRQLVELHGGRIDAFSEGPGRGSVFVVHLPLSRTGARQPVAPAHVAPAPGTRGRFLVVDDNRDAADSLALLLQSLGAEVRVVYDGPTALDTLADFQPAAVLLDLGMPHMDGYEAARRMREHPQGECVHLIALTGWGQDEDRRRTTEAGFDRHLVKPVDRDTLLRLVEAVGGASADG